MKRIIWRHGWYAAFVIAGLSAISFSLLSTEDPDYGLGEVIGYTTMALSMVFVFLGIRNYRDRVNAGSISFARGLQIGILIALFPALAFGIIDQVYSKVINPDFYDEYYAYTLEQLDVDTPEAYQAEVQRIEAERAMFSSPWAQFTVMFLTVMIVGFIVSLLSAWVLKRSK